MNELVVLGSTGSIGLQTLDLVRRNPGRFKVTGLSAGRNLTLLLEQVQEFRPGFIALADEDVKVPGELPCEVFRGESAAEKLVAETGDAIVLVATLGFAALRPVLAALASGRKLALANKECLVAGGDLVMAALRSSSGRIVPVDSEHSSLYQLLGGITPDRKVRKLTITASGGPFLSKTLDELREVTPAQAVKHPRWNMGAKISVDSATLMNKGLEVIEAAKLFDVAIDRVKVFVHPESVVHGLIELTDGVTLACLYTADMRLPIAYALDELCGVSRELESGVTELDLCDWGKLTFIEPDLERFRCLRLAYQAGEAGGSATAALNAANEVAVESFLQGELQFLAIPRIVEEVLESHQVMPVSSLEHVLAVDRDSRMTARKLIAARRH